MALPLYPDLVASFDAELPFEQVRRDRQSMLRICRRLVLSGTFRPDSGLAHQPCDSLAAHVDAGFGKLAMDPRRAVAGSNWAKSGWTRRADRRGSPLRSNSSSPFRSFASIRVRGAMLDAMRKNAVLPRRAWDKVRADQAAQLIGEGNLEAIHAPDADAATTDDRFLDEHLSSMVTAAAMRFANDSERSAGPPWTPERVPRKRWSGRLLSIVEQAMKFS